MIRMNFTLLLSLALLICAFTAQAKVNHVYGNYSERPVDLTVKSPGGSLAISRYYIKGVWSFELDHDALDLIVEPNGLIETIKREKLSYKNLPSIPNYYSHGTQQVIQKIGSGYRWSDRSDGSWAVYDGYGRLISRGRLNQTRESVVRNDFGQVIAVLNGRGLRVFQFEYDAVGHVHAVSDYSGRRVTYGYHVSQMISFTNVMGGVWRYAYGKNGYLTRRQDPLGRTLNITYAEDGKVSSVLDQGGVGNSYVFSSGKAGRPYHVRIVNSGGRVSEYTYDNQRVLREKNVNGKVIQKVDGAGKSATREDAAGNKTELKYDEYDNVIERKYADGSKVSYSYHPRYSFPLVEVNKDGLATTYSYDAYANLLSRTYATGTPTADTTSYTYDSLGQQLSITRAGITYSYTYDPYGNVATSTGPEGTTATTYDVLGNPLTITNRLGQQRSNSYDAAGNLLTRSDAEGNTQSYTYDVGNRRISKTDANGNVTHYTYNIRNQLIAFTDAAGGVTRKELDVAARRIRLVDAEGNVTSRSYDEQGRISTIINGSGDTTQVHYNIGEPSQISRIDFPTFSRIMSYDQQNHLISSSDIIDIYTTLIARYGYDSEGNLKSITSPKGRITTYEYDVWDRKVAHIDPAGGTTRFGYNAKGHLISVTDANGNPAFRYEYDTVGHIVKDIRPMGQFSQNVFNAQGELTELTDALGNKITYDYSPAGRSVAIHYPATTNNTAKTTSFSYDANGNFTGYNDGTTSGSYSYDALNRKISESVNYGAFTLTSNYGYYKNGKKKSFTGPDGTIISYVYDANRQLKNINIPGQGSIDYYSYNWLSGASQITLPGGSSKNYQYDTLFRPVDIHMKDPSGQTLMHYQFSNDQVTGNITQNNTEHGQYSYGYDILNRLISANYPTQANESFAYDKVGNRIVYNNDVANPWLYNENNELMSRPNASYQYDDNGNQIKKIENGVVTDYIYNTEGRIALVKQGATTIASYYYDPLGRRLSKTANGTTTYFFYTDEGLSAETDHLGNIAQTYGYEPGGLWGTSPLYTSYNGNYYYYLNDHIGAPRQLINKNGVKSWEANYKAFGKTNITIETVRNNLRFPGQYLDVETGDYYNYNRTYDFSTGRYTRSDPIGMGGGVNVFSYVDGNPVSRVDPEGLAAVVFPVAAAIALAIAAAQDRGVAIPADIPDDWDEHGLIYCVTHPLVCASILKSLNDLLINATTGNSNNTCETCENSPTLSGYKECKDLPTDYKYFSEYEARTETNLIGWSRGALDSANMGEMSRSPCKNTWGEATAKHHRWMPPRALKFEKFTMSTMSCECCDDSSGKPKPFEKWRVSGEDRPEKPRKPIDPTEFEDLWL